MRLKCDREQMLHVFQIAASVAPSRSPKPILQNAKLSATDDGVVLMATDLDVGIRIDAGGCTVETAGDVLLPIGRFLGILRESSDEQLTIEWDGGRTRVWGQRSEFQLPSANPEEFPTVEAFRADKYYELSTRFFKEAVRRTVFATDSESTRYALGGVLLELAGKSMTAIATDGRRLAKQTGPGAASSPEGSGEQAAIVPTRAMQLMDRALTNLEEDLALAVCDNDVLLKSSNTTIFARLVEGRFPKWRDVFPASDASAAVDLTVGPFFSAVRQAAIVTSEERRGVDFNFGAGKVTLAAHGAELGESHIELPIAYEGPEILITLDPRYLSDFLKVLDPDQTFRLQLQNAETAAVCETDDGYAYVIMPLARSNA